jgi:hypothetical protein
MMTRHSVYRLLFFLLALGISGIALSKDKDGDNSTQKETAEVLKPNKGETLEGKVADVIDGETLTVAVGKAQCTVRLLDVKTKDKNQVFSNESKKKLSDKVLDKTVKVVSQGQNNKGQTLGIVTLVQADQSKSYWLTTSSNTRHNSKCRYYQQTKGRPCGPDEGKPCKLCGGEENLRR